MKVSIVVTRYNEPYSIISPCVRALAKQKNVEATVYFFDQKKDDVLKKLCGKLSNKKIKFRYMEIPPQSLSNVRNLGISMSKNDIILFTDGDGIPDENWAYELARIYQLNKKIAIVGGKSYPKWLKRPRWYHNSNIIKEIYSLISLSDKVISTEKVVGVCYSLNKKRLGKLADFKEKLGRKDGKLYGGDETDVCTQAKKRGLLVYYNPKAAVAHQIPEERVSIRWVIKRMYYGGYSRALRGGRPKTFHKERNIYDRILIFPLLIPYALGYWKGMRTK